MSSSDTIHVEMRDGTHHLFPLNGPDVPRLNLTARSGEVSIGHIGDCLTRGVPVFVDVIALGVAKVEGPDPPYHWRVVSIRELEDGYEISVFLWRPETYVEL